MQSKNLLRRVLIPALVLCTLTPLAAQEDVAVISSISDHPGSFFMAVLAGVLLAAGFQFLLTNLAVATGISMIGDVEDKYYGKEDDDRGRNRERARNTGDRNAAAENDMHQEQYDLDPRNERRNQTDRDRPLGDRYTTTDTTSSGYTDRGDLTDRDDYRGRNLGNTGPTYRDRDQLTPEERARMSGAGYTEEERARMGNTGYTDRNRPYPAEGQVGGMENRDRGYTQEGNPDRRDRDRTRDDYGRDSVYTQESNVTGMADRDRYRDYDRQYAYDDDDDQEADTTPTAVKISNAFGVFTMITLSISLFFASMLAVKLSLIPTNGIGLTLGLVIWAGFFLLLMYLEARSVSSLVGGIFNTVFGGLRSAASTVGHAFSTSETTKARHMAEATVQGIRDELRRSLNTNDLSQKLDEYVRQLRPEWDMNTMKTKLAELINEIEVDEELGRYGDNYHRRIFLNVASQQPNVTREDLQRLGSMYDQVRAAARRPGTPADKAAAVFDTITPGTEEDSRRTRERLAAYLRDTNREELHPDRLRQDLEQILAHPSDAPEVVRQRLRQFDRGTLVALLSQRGDLTEQQADSIITTFQNVVDNISQRLGISRQRGGTGATTTTAESDYMTYRPRAENYYSREGGFSQTYGGDGDYERNETSQRVENRVREWFDRMDRPELRYERVHGDLQRILDDPASTPKVLRNRLRYMDRESFISLLSNNSYISEDQARRLADQYERARQRVVQTAEDVEHQVRYRLRQAEHTAVRQAEAARQTAASAAWWLLATAIVSAAASALGGVLAYTLG